MSYIPNPNQSVSGTIGASIVGLPAFVISSSVLTVGAGVANQSVSGTVGASVVGHAPVVIVGGSVAASFTPPANQSVSGTVQSEQTGTWIVSVISANPSSMLVGASIIGLTPVTAIVTGNPSISGQVGASIIGQLPAGTAPIGSVATLQGTNPWLVSFGNSSIFALPVGSFITKSQDSSILAVPVGSFISLNIGSVITVSKDSSVLSVPVGSTIAVLQAPSIVGTYAEDAGHTQSDKGIFHLNVRNDTMASITSADLDYSPAIVGPSGETIVANSPLTKWVQGNASIVGGISQPVIAAQGASIFTYITGIQLVNTTATNAYVTFLDSAAGSKIGYTVAPANGGSNIIYPNGLKTLANGAFHASINALASVLISAQGFISKS